MKPACSMFWESQNIKYSETFLVLALMPVLLLRVDQMVYKAKEAAIWCSIKKEYVKVCCYCMVLLVLDILGTMHSCKMLLREVSMQITWLKMKMWPQVLHWIVMQLYWISKWCLPKIISWYNWSILDPCTEASYDVYTNWLNRTFNSLVYTSYVLSTV